ncbi:hypothetical protein CN200_30695 [Sinorhizobium meliloti]|uniref:DUF6118 family protein n=5 Tax=Rhizobium meliloti TaxID=382 RepID=UPI000FD51C17|nr:DUF6118 family protein [Sinorhizobium meliloti]RVI06559.1 hypothetical protein CN200_30695 [Sinorhizobium meliloti]RVM70416.1 hypothetical protein CN126_27335 [Sinorhizobium meliloti]RVN83887.1 hypothetical protein CN107_22445 [Sinorhizobium meliloti]RVN99009.1 hypothetical protein CN103_31965 [Sinorhizobium meliloti]
MAEEYRDEDLDGRDDLEPDTSPEDDAGDPAAAFEALRETVEDLAANLTREMTTIRKGVETAFDQIERQGTPVDYSAELGRIVQSLTTVGERLKAVEQSPVLRQGADHYARALERSGDGLVRNAVQQLERQASDLERISGVLASHSRSAFLRKDQDIRMWTAAGFGIIAGMSLLLLLPRFLPFSADSHVASLVMGRDRVSAGYAMIEAADPFTVKKMKWGGQFYDAGGGEILACLENARQTGKDQKCTVSVPAPEKER